MGLQEKVAKAQEVKDLAMTGLTQAIEEEKKEQWRAEGRQMLFDAKRVSRRLTPGTYDYLSVFVVQVRVSLLSSLLRPSFTTNKTLKKEKEISQIS